ncbi:hypothetical protein P4493_05995 [Bacillus thuringiensis]|jgi:hypothetical protein|uniref:Uncharacterized protein n=3 Tax=Bacillus thuringiensis TaxID=1428 RepID=A0A0B5N873_BACTU|nr:MULTISPECIES: hypothetical protein [Bacillus]MEC2533115.1 hypothetical protein [Bacillus cereus]MED1153905.1 hypothetical protein [Bacillus paranthracis]OUB09251.1 hypothetical protein BK708_32470 [Bacillus thuringiensis serovar yunnanensis]AFQ30213.1 hypothetical protein BTF1_30562 [Bacillus thuringiensis HD-789]AJG73954.1 hypothetical protein BF38_6021 [Bacillus thuringiensis]
MKVIQIMMSNNQPALKSNQVYQIRVNNLVTNQFMGEDLFKNWCKLFGIRPTKLSEIKEAQFHTATWQSNHQIFERGFSSLSEVPQGAIKCCTVLGANVVEAYVVNQDLISYIYVPILSLARQLVVPNVSVRDFISYNGYIAKVQ